MPHILTIEKGVFRHICTTNQLACDVTLSSLQGTLTGLQATQLYVITAARWDSSAVCDI